MKKKLLTIALAALCPFFAASAQEIKPLTIGDSIPKSLWNTPLQVVNHPKGKDTIILNDYRGKLIILDFWDTWCGNCIAAMPKLVSMQQHYNNKLSILAATASAKPIIKEFWKKNNILRNTSLPSVVADTTLRTFFPHTMVPHVVWIDENGIVQGITSGRELSFETLEKHFAGSPLLLEKKEDVLNFNPNKPFLIDNNGGNQQNFLYRSILSGYMPGLPSMSGLYRDSTRQAVVARATNSSIISLYKLAFPDFQTMPQKRWILNVDDPSDFYFSGEIKSKPSWNKKNLYSYEVSLPAEDSTLIRKFIRQDLDRFFRVKSSILKSPAWCLVLSRQRSNTTVTKLKTDCFTTDKVFKDAYAHDVIFWMNSVKELPVALNESDYTGKVTISINKGTRLEDLNAQLKKYNLQMSWEKRNITYFQIMPDRDED